MAPRIVEVSDKDKRRKRQKRMGLPKINKIFTTTELKSLPGFTTHLGGKDIDSDGEKRLSTDNECGMDPKPSTDPKDSNTKLDTTILDKCTSSDSVDNTTVMNSDTSEKTISDLQDNETEILDKAELPPVDAEPKQNSVKNKDLLKTDIKQNKEVTDSTDHQNPAKNMIQEDSCKPLHKTKNKNNLIELGALQKIADSLDNRGNEKKTTLFTLQQDPNKLSLPTGPFNMERSLNSDGEIDITINSPLSSSSRSISSSSSGRSSVTSPYATNTFIYADWPTHASGKRAKTSKLKLFSEQPVPCAHCKKKVQSKYLLYSLDRYWHEKCLKCDFCRKPLFKFGDRFYFRQGAKFCHDDFAR